MKDDYTTNSHTTSPKHFSIKGWENVLFELGVKGLKGRSRPPGQSKGPFTHAIFDAISDAILRAKRA